MNEILGEINDSFSTFSIVHRCTDFSLLFQSGISYAAAHAFVAPQPKPHLDLMTTLDPRLLYCDPCEKVFATVSVFREHMSFKHFKREISQEFVIP